MNDFTKKLVEYIKDNYYTDLTNSVIASDSPEEDFIKIKDKLYVVYKDSKVSVEDLASYIIADTELIDEDKEVSEYLLNEDPWLINGKEHNSQVSEDATDNEDEDLVADEVENVDSEEEYTTAQAKILDELSYLISTEYEAIKWYDEAIPMIQISDMDEDLIVSTILGIEEIRKDEEDHVAHLERLIKQIKENRLIEGTNGNE